MRNLKKILALVLALMMVVSVMATASAAEYADADKITYTQAVEVMSELAILQGDGTNFNPAGELNRAEAAVIITKILLKSNLKTLAQEADALANTFTDVSATHWGLDYIKYCANLGIIIGNGNGKFDPAGKLTGYAFAKMLLIAAGIGESDDYLGTATQTWESKVLAAAKKAGLLDHLDGVVLSKNITREQAAQMALDAMKANAVETTYYYVIDTKKTDSTADDVQVGKHLDMTDAYIMASILGGQDDGFKVTSGKEYSGTLLAGFSVNWNPNGADEFGRPATVYTYNYGKSSAYDVSYPSTPVATYTTATQPTAVLADLGGYALYEVGNTTNYYVVADDTEADWNVTVVDGPDTDTLGEGVSFELIAGLTGLNKVVEVYANAYGVVNKIVVVETKFGYVSDIHEANKIYGTPELFEMPDGSVNVNSIGVKENVPYTWNATTLIDGYSYAVNVTPAVGFEGTLTAYNNRGTVTINGTNYYIDNLTLMGTVVDQMGQKAVYYVGANGSIIGTGDVAENVIGNYAQILAADVKYENGLWSTASAEVQVLAVLSDGTCAVYNLPVYTHPVSGALYVLNGTTPVVITEETEGDDIAAAFNSTYTYVLNGTDIALVADVAGGVSYNTVYAAATTEALERYALDVDAGVEVLINSDTTFILDVDGEADTYKYTTVKGSDGITEITSGNATVIYKKVLNKDGEVAHYVATHVFALSNKPASTVSSFVPTNYVYVSDVYTVSYDVTLAPVYTYVGYKTDGSVESIVSNTEVAVGVWTYDPATKKVATDIEMNTGDVEAIAGTTYKIGGNFYTITDSAIVVVIDTGAKLELGAGVEVKDVNGDGLIDLVYVVAEAD